MECARVSAHAIACICGVARCARYTCWWSASPSPLCLFAVCFVCFDANCAAHHDVCALCARKPNAQMRAAAHFTRKSREIAAAPQLRIHRVYRKKREIKITNHWNVSEHETYRQLDNKNISLCTNVLSFFFQIKSEMMVYWFDKIFIFSVPHLRNKRLLAIYYIRFILCTFRHRVVDDTARDTLYMPKGVYIV